MDVDLVNPVTPYSNMEACTAVEKEIDKVLNKFTSYNEILQSSITSLLQDVENVKKEVDAINNQSGEIPKAKMGQINTMLIEVRDKVTQLSSDHRDLHSSVSKVGKAIDKNFTSDFSCITKENEFDGPKQSLVDEVIIRHFFREGLLDVAESLIKESKVDMKEEAREPFFELNRILAALKNKDLDPAFLWVAKNRDRLNEQKSNLEFLLHRLAYISILQEGEKNHKAAIEYARKNFPPFVKRHEKAIQSLLCSVLYLRSGIASSPYSDLLNANHWTEICEVFTRDACALLGLAADSPLAVCIDAGCSALPVLLNIKQVMQQCNMIDELPIEIDLEPNCLYHSIFACPILRQQATDNNPPMRLSCGHIISKDALNKISNGAKLKCPYCPVEQRLTDATQIYF